MIVLYVNFVTAFSVIVREPKIEVDVMRSENSPEDTTQKTTQKIAQRILDAIGKLENREQTAKMVSESVEKSVEKDNFSAETSRTLALHRQTFISEKGGLAIKIAYSTLDF